MTGTWLLAGFLLWMIVALAYLNGLRRVLAAREHMVLWDLSLLADRAGAWKTVLEGLERREWREAAFSVGRALEVLGGDRDLNEKVLVSRELGLLLQEEKALVSNGASRSSPEERERLLGLEGALQQLGADLASYHVSAADATYACERFPLSLLARVVGLRARPVSE